MIGHGRLNLGEGVSQITKQRKYGNRAEHSESPVRDQDHGTLQQQGEKESQVRSVPCFEN